MVLAGKDGYVHRGSNRIAYIDNFSINIDQGTAEASSFENDWKEYLATAKGASGSFSGTFDYGDTNGQKALVDELISNGGDVELQLKTSMGLVLVLDSHISGAAVNGSHGDKVSVSFNFQTSGVPGKKMAPPAIRQLGNTISMQTETGGTIYYTTNGDTPTTSSTQYTDEFDITGDLTIKAIAVMDGYSNSDVAIKEATYTA